MERSAGQIFTQVFYCDPNMSQQKGSCENNHEFIRRIIPKGRSMPPLYPEGHRPHDEPHQLLPEGRALRTLSLWYLHVHVWNQHTGQTQHKKNRSQRGTPQARASLIAAKLSVPPSPCLADDFLRQGFHAMLQKKLFWPISTSLRLPGPDFFFWNWFPHQFCLCQTSCISACCGYHLQSGVYWVRAAFAFSIEC